MGGDDSQKLLPWRGAYSSPGRSKPPAPCRINTLTHYLESEALLPDAVFRTTYFLSRRNRTVCLGHFAVILASAEEIALLRRARLLNVAIPAHLQHPDDVR